MTAPGATSNIFSTSYDAIFSIGVACKCAIYLKRADLRIMSGPMDWVFEKNITSILSRVHAIESRFARWMEPEDMIEIGRDTRIRVFHNRHTNFVFLHDFPLAIPEAQALAEAQARYSRRQQRFFKTIESSTHILLAWVNYGECPSTTDAIALEAITRLRSTLGEHVDLLIIEHNPDLPPHHVQTSTPTDGLLVARLSLYKTAAPEKKELDENSPLVTAIFKRIHIRKDLAVALRKRKRKQWLITHVLKIVAGLCPSRSLRQKLRQQNKAL